MGTFINENFVSIKINGKKGEGPEIKKSLSVYGYPTIVFIDTDGTELDRISGWDGDKENFTATLKDYLQGKGTFKAMLAELESSPDDLELNYAMAQKYLSRWESSKAAPYFKKVLALDPQDEKNYSETARCYVAMDQMWTDKKPQKLETFVKNCTSKELLKKSFSSLVRYYTRQDDTENAILVYDTYLSKFPDDAGLMNGFAWFIYEQKLQDQYAKGVKIAERAVELEPEAAHIWDTLGWLYYESKEYPSAVMAMGKAVELEPETEGFKKNLDKFKLMLN